MTLPEALVGRLTLAVRSNDRGALAEAPKALERATRDALLGAARALGEEVLVVRRMQIELRAAASGLGNFATASGVSELRTLIEQSLGRHLAPSGLSTDAASASDSVARYSSEAVACAERLIGLLSATSEQWPRRALARFGSSVEAVLDYAFSRSRAFAGTSLSHVVVSGVWPDLLATSSLAERIAHWVEEGAGPSHPSRPEPNRDSLARIPSEVLARARVAAHATIRRLEQAPSAPAPATRRIATRRLALLGELFRQWPPARDWRMGAVELDSLLGDEAAEQVLVSRAGSLVFWALQLEQFELLSGYGNLRQRKAVCWALGRVLEAASLPATDPLLALFAGEIPGTPLAVAATLRDTDPEPIVVRALRLVANEALEGALRVVPFGNDAVLMASDGIVLDSLAETSPEDAIPDLVKRFRARLNRTPSALETCETLTSADREAIAAADSVAVAAAWQHALRTVVSVLHHSARRRFGVLPQALHGWNAIITAGPTVELRSVDVTGLAEGSWLQPRVNLGGTDHAVVVR